MEELCPAIFALAALAKKKKLGSLQFSTNIRTDVEPQSTYYAGFHFMINGPFSDGLKYVLIYRFESWPSNLAAALAKVPEAERRLLNTLCEIPLLLHSRDLI